MVTQQTPTSLQELEIEEWLRIMRGTWAQGEHVAIVGPTGRGKTTVAHQLLDLRKYVVVLAVKRDDDTLDRFKSGGTPAGRASGYRYTKYRVIKRWPPEHNWHRVVLWLKPSSFRDLHTQAYKLYRALEDIYLAGGWTVYFDEAGYIAGNLGLSRQLGILLNQGRSSGLTVVCAMTRPHSMVAKIPSETLNQCRHILCFKYTDEREIKSCAEIAGVSNRLMQHYMSILGEYDFLYVHGDKTVLVRN